jgi:hypothetical protein
MPSTRLALSIAALIVLSAPMLGATTSAKHHHKRAIHKHSQTHSQAKAPANQVEVINGSSRTVQDLNMQQSLAPSTSKSGAPSEVDVINGYSERTQILNPEPSPQVHSAARSVHGKSAKLASSKKNETASSQVINVEVFNGARTETRTFNGDPEQMTVAERYRRSHQRVVVGFESADSARRRKNTKPVVTGIVTSESESERAKANPVVVAIASSERRSDGVDAVPTPSLPPRYSPAPNPPKRPPYRPTQSVSQ